MLRTIIKRLLQGILVLFLLETVTFFLIRQLPGHPFIGEKNLPDHILLQLQQNYGLDQTPLVQYSHYWKNLLMHGDLGPSLTKDGQSVMEILAQSFPVSLELGVLAMLLAIIIGIPAGIVSALYRNKWPDALFMLMAMLGICIPVFVLGPLFGLSLGTTIPGLSVAGWDSPGCIILPALTLGLVNAAYLARLTRGGMLEVLSQDYIRTARAKGVPPFRLLFVHALRGGLQPALSYLGPAFAALISGSFVIETCFQIPGMGQHFVNATTGRDYFLIQGLVLFYGALIVIANLGVDLVQMLLNPKLRQSS